MTIDCSAIKIDASNAALVLAVLEGSNGELMQVKARMQRALLTYDSALHAKEAARYAQVKAWVEEAKAVIDAQASTGSVREIAGNSFIGRRTPKGIVVREMHKGEAIAQWFVSNRTGEVLRMPFGGGRFEQCLSEREAERVAFFARRMPE